MKTKIAPAIDTLRLDEQTFLRIVDRLDRASSKTADQANHQEDQRRHLRIPFRTKLKFIVRVESDGYKRNFIVRARDVSNSGIGFLHGSFINLESKCFIQMINPTLGTMDVPGLIRRCNHIEKNVHLIGMEFNNEIDIDALLKSESS